MKKEIKTVLIYARRSGNKQSDTSLPQQVAWCKAKAVSLEATVTGIYEDDAISAGTAQRDGYQQMLADARRKKCDAIVAFDLSRFWRNDIEQPIRLAELRGLKVHVVCGDYDSRDPGARLLACVKGGMNAEFRAVVAAGTYRGQRDNAERDMPTGGRTYGYGTVVVSVDAKGKATKKLVVVEAQAKIVRRIFKAYRDGYSPRQIAGGLNKDRVPSPGANWNRKERRSDGKWMHLGVRAILRNPKYNAKFVWGTKKWTRMESDSAIRICEDATEVPVVRDRPDLRIVDGALWTAVQKRIKANAHEAGKPRKSVAIRYPLSGLLKCGHCGANYAIADRYNYGCSSNRNGGRHACRNEMRVSRTLAEQLVFESLNDQSRRPEWFAETSKWYKDRMEAGLKAEDANRDNDAKRRAELERKIANITDAIADGPSKALTQKLRDYEAELAALATVEPVKSNVIPMFAPKRLQERFCTTVRDLIKAAKEDAVQARQLLRQLIGDTIRVVADKGEPVLLFDVPGAQLDFLAGIKLGPETLVGSGGRI